MNLSFGLTFFLLLLVTIAFDLSYAGTKKYEFVPAKCEDHHTEKKIGGPLSICTFPPKYKPVAQEDIDAVIEHIQSLKFN